MLASGVVIVLALNPTRTAAAWNVSLSHIRAPSLLDTARASVNVTTAASARRASVSQVWPVGRRTEPEALEVIACASAMTKAWTTAAAGMRCKVDAHAAGTPRTYTIWELLKMIGPQGLSTLGI